ncbi:MULTISPECIES: restriction endonuclease subunit S [unclassified Streptomyces]|uniref:restriction endonuclease subunit S n=1 Tax=unclassified Streptomyces TaxID=2593676 RepID=UPI002E18A137
MLKVSAVHASGYRPGENKAVDDPALIRPRFEVRPGDLLFSRANTPELVGSVCIATPSQERLMLSDKTLRLVVDERLAVPEFVRLSLASPAVRKQIAVSASGSSLSMQNISQASVETLRLRWPTLAEQRRIVEVLGAVAEQEARIQASQAKLELVERGLIEAEALRSDCATSCIGDLGVVSTGTTPPTRWDVADAGEGIPFLTPTQVPEGIGRVGEPDRRLSSSRSSDLRLVTPGATLAVCVGFGAGKVGFSETICCTNQQINSVMPSADYDRHFVYLTVRRAMARAKSQLNLQVTPIINKTDFMRLPVFAPSLDEQTRIADMVWSLRGEYQAFAQELTKLVNLRRGLTDHLLAEFARA